MDLIPRNVPWRDWEEWTEVKLCFFHPESTSSSTEASRAWVSKGIEMVNVWRARGGLPHSVESTACLLQIEGCDGAAEELENGSNGGSPPRRQRPEMELRMTYSLAIIRAVNGLVDPSQKGLYADSIMSIAAARGLPSWIVELRHDGTHNQLPILSVLRAASTHLIQWFYNNYWEVQSQHIFSCFDSFFETTEDSGEDGDGTPPGVIDRNAIEKVTEICPTGISGPFMARILHSREDCYGGDNEKKFDSRVFKSMCRMKHTTVVDMLIARVVKHALDQVDQVDLVDMQRKDGDERNSILAAMHQCRELLTLAQEPWREMHEDVLEAHEGAEEGSSSSAKDAYHDRKTPARLLHLYWNSLQARASVTLTALEKRQSGKGDVDSRIMEPLRFICETFQGLNAVLSKYRDGEGESSTAPNSSPSSSSSTSTQKKRKRDKEADSFTLEAPSNWTVFNPERAMAWPLGIDPKL